MAPQCTYENYANNNTGALNTLRQRLKRCPKSYSALICIIRCFLHFSQNQQVPVTNRLPPFSATDSRRILIFVVCADTEASSARERHRVAKNPWLRVRPSLGGARIFQLAGHNQVTGVDGLPYPLAGLFQSTIKNRLFYAE
jgi:hypothetical protein